MSERGGPTLKGAYFIDKQVISESAYVDTGRAVFLVVSHFRTAWKTLVFEYIFKPDTWVLRREIDQKLDPVAAVTGTVLSNSLWLDPISELKRDLKRANEAFDRLLNEKLKARKGR